jgi:hypothetical protein
VYKLSSTSNRPPPSTTRPTKHYTTGKSHYLFNQSDVITYADLHVFIRGYGL